MRDIKSMIDSSMKQDWNKKGKGNHWESLSGIRLQAVFFSKVYCACQQNKQKKINDSAHIELWELAAQKQANSIQ